MVKRIVRQLAQANENLTANVLKEAPYSLVQLQPDL